MDYYEAIKSNQKNTLTVTVTVQYCLQRKQSIYILQKNIYILYYTIYVCVDLCIYTHTM